MLNARQALPVGGRLRVATRPSSDGAWAEARFHDTGHGVPPEAVERLFEPYFTTRAEEGGNGIGLAISRDIVRKMHGELERPFPGSPDEPTLTISVCPVRMSWTKTSWAALVSPGTRSGTSE